MNQPKVIYDENGKVVYSAYSQGIVMAVTEAELVELKYDEKVKERKFRSLSPVQKELVGEFFPIDVEKPDPTSIKF